MKRRSFFLGLGAVFTSALLGKENGLNSNKKRSLASVANDKTGECTYRCHISKPGSFKHLSQEERVALKNLRRDFRKNGRLLVVSTMFDEEASKSNDDNVHLIVDMSFDSKTSRDDYVQAFESLLYKKSNVLS